MTNKKFTDEEIIKALRCCVKVRNCGECPVKDEPVSECLIITCTNAADIIERQKAFIEIQNELISKLALAGKNATTEAYKEFAEKLKETSVLRAGCVPWYDIHAAIDYLLKEMVDEEE